MAAVLHGRGGAAHGRARAAENGREVPLCTSSGFVRVRPGGRVLVLSERPSLGVVAV